LRLFDNEKKDMQDFDLNFARWALRRGSALLLDVRTAAEQQQGYLCEAMLIEAPSLPPLDAAQRLTLQTRLIAALKLVPRDTMLIVYCKKGVRAELARQLLHQAGFGSVAVLGGVEEPPLKALFDKCVGSLQSCVSLFC
jgi:rhodanese-related sulfurtransferase